MSSSLVANASQSKEIYTKNIKKEYSINSDGKAIIDNMYGLIDVQTWDKDKIRIDVLISIKTRSEDNANKAFEKINIDFTNNKQLVTAKTTFTKSNFPVFNFGNLDMTIDYLVYIPSSLNLDINNKYGDLRMPDLEGLINVNLKYGDGMINSTCNQLNLNLSYGDLQVNKAVHVSANVSYGKLNIKECDHLSLNSKYSELMMANASKAILDSKYDDIFIDRVADLDCSLKYSDGSIAHADKLFIECQYSDLKIGKVTNSAGINTTYGTVNLGLSNGFGDVKINGKYTDFKVNVEKESNFRISASGDYAGIAYPAGMKVTYEVDKNSFHEVEGYKGIQGSKSNIKARISYGGLAIN